MDSALNRRSRKRRVITVAAESLLTVAVLLAIYYMLPTAASILVGSATWVVIFLGVVAFELRAVVRNAQPVGRAAIAMARVVPLFIGMFAWIYFAMSTSDPRTFTEPLSRSGALYFTITILSTVGFGDITQVSDPARLAVSVQMISDLVVVGIIVKLIVGVAICSCPEGGRRGRRAGSNGFRVRRDRPRVALPDSLLGSTCPPGRRVALPTLEPLCEGGEQFPEGARERFPSLHRIVVGSLRLFDQSGNGFALLDGRRAWAPQVLWPASCGRSAP